MILSAYIRCESVHNITRWLKKLDSLSIAIQMVIAHIGTENIIFELKVINFTNTNHNVLV
jgi:hypothetical protein